MPSHSPTPDSEPQDIFVNDGHCVRGAVPRLSRRGSTSAPGSSVQRPCTLLLCVVCGLHEAARSLGAWSVQRPCTTARVLRTTNSRCSRRCARKWTAHVAKRPTTDPQTAAHPLPTAPAEAASNWAAPPRTTGARTSRSPPDVDPDADDRVDRPALGPCGVLHRSW